MNRHRPGLLRSEWVVALALLVLVPAIVGIVLLGRQQNQSQREARAAERAQQAALERSQAADAWARYDAQIEACERGKVLRSQVNDNIEVVQALGSILTAVLTDSAIAKLREGDPDRANQLKDSRDRVLKVADRLRPVTQPVCREVIERPTVKRPVRGSGHD